MADAAIDPPRTPFSTILKNAALTALVALILAIPLVGLETVAVGAGALTVRTRFDWVAYATVAVFLGRLLLGLWLARRPPRSSTESGFLTKAAAFGSLHAREIAVVGILFAVVLPFFSSSTVIYVATSVLIYVMLGWGLNVVVGLAGLLDLGYVAFYAVGAYSFALFAQWFDLTFWEALPLGGILAAVFGIALGFPVLRLRGDYLAIVTLGFGEIIRIVLVNWGDVTGGPNGILNIPGPTFFGMPFSRNAPPGQTTFHQFFGLDYTPLHGAIFLYFIILALALLTNWFTIRLRKLPIGRAWEALREDEIACRALGLNPTNVKLSAFAIGAMLGGFAGAFFATRATFISPESFTFIESAMILMIVVLGGMGSQLGVVLAAIVVVTLPELRKIPILEWEPGQYRMLLFGMAMVGIMIWRPRGLLAHREPSLRLFGRKGKPE